MYVCEKVRSNAKKNDLVKTFDLVRNSIGYCYKSELNFFQESN